MTKRIKGFLTLLIFTVLITTSPFSAFADDDDDDDDRKRPKVKYYHLDRAHKAGEIRGSFQRCTGDSSGLFVYVVGRSFSALLTPAGDYTLSYVPPGSYSLAFVKDNHILTTVDGIEVRKRRLTDLGPIEHCVDADNDGFDESVDCNDNNPSINPNATEVCDGADNNCSGQVDDVPEGCLECTDADNDGSFAQDECEGPVDCDDNDPTVSPNAQEVCNDGLDNNCDGTTDENCACPSGTEDCDYDGFCETDLNNDSNNCGTCGAACGAGQTCEGGICQITGCAAGEACDDGNVCTTNDTCDTTGTCVGVPLSCDDGNSCTDDVCIPSIGCSNTSKAEGSACDDGNACTVNDVCITGACGGTPQTCNDGDNCTQDTCNPATGQCVQTSISCESPDACHAGFCDQASGDCVQTPVVCTPSDTCHTSACDPINGCVETPIVCTPLNSCHSSFCDLNTGGCNDVPVENGTPCENGGTCQGGDCIPPTSCPNNCSNNGVCQGGQCVCNPGFAGEACEVDIDECAASPCDANATCFDGSGTFTCVCDTGYQGNGFTCVDIDECATGTDTCSPTETCVNTPGGFQCEPAQCQVSEWGSFSECSAECGGGAKTRTRTIMNGADPANCPPLQETVACNTQPCPVDCVLSEWSPWGVCSAECGGGTQTRTRSIIQQPQFGGAACGPTTEILACNPQPCGPGFECDPAFGECSTP